MIFDPEHDAPAECTRDAPHMNGIHQMPEMQESSGSRRETRAPPIAWQSCVECVANVDYFQLTMSALSPSPPGLGPHGTGGF